MGKKIAIPLLGILCWILSMNSGSFTNASVVKIYPVYGEQIYSTQLKPSYNKQKNGFPILKLSEKNLNDSIHFGENMLGFLNRLECNLGRSEVKIQPNTPEHGQSIESRASLEGLEQARAALVVARASQNLVNLHCQKYTVNKVHCAQLLSNFKLFSTPLQDFCNLADNNSCTEEDLESPYRTIDGSCNNKQKNSQGESFTQYRRMLFPNYLDGIMVPRRSVTKKALPSPRLISAKIIKDIDRFDAKLTLGFMQWSQFVAHDMAHTASSKMISADSTIVCCDRQGFVLSPRYMHPMCMPINIPADDHFYSKHRTNCMSYVRSLPALRNDCSFGPLEQMNQATHYLDGSHIYGSSLNVTNSLREFNSGRLLVSKRQGKSLLPTVSDSQDLCQVDSENKECFKAGDSRVNMQPHLTAMHTFWTREHNRIAEELERINRHWSDEILFQESRKIVSAQIQHITYSEWLPYLIGKTHSDKINSQNVYKETIDASVSNEFSTAAIKFVNSLYTSELEIYEENRQANSSLRLQDYFNRPVGLDLDGLIRGLATQRSQMMDLQFISDVTQQLYKTNLFGMDALSLDIQRGRDHGLPSYLNYRDHCGLRKIHEFPDFTDHVAPAVVNILRQVYASPQDVDLVIGALAERPMPESLLGPTFNCIIREQMERTKFGDRFFYTSHLSRDQLQEIKKSTLARIFCDNGENIKTMQRDVFTVINQENNLVDCSSDLIQRVDLTKWRETSILKF